jgi:hypothetical protein
MNGSHLLVKYSIERCQKLSKKDVAAITNYDALKYGQEYAFMRVLAYYYIGLFRLPFQLKFERNYFLGSSEHALW